MNIGREIVASVIQDNHLQDLLDAGLTYNWLHGSNTGSEVIFSGIDKQAYSWILEHWKRHHKIPSMSLFRENFPEETYKIPSAIISASELAELAEKKINSYLVADIIGRVIDLHDKNKINDAITLLRSESERISNGIKYRDSKAYDLSDPEFDVDALLNTKLEMGIPLGIDKVDEEFYGFQSGQLISLMGRQKSGKSWLTLNSALQAWKEGYTVLFFSVEMDTHVLRQRLLAMGAHVSPSRMRRGHLTQSDQEKVRAFNRELIKAGQEEEVRFFISKKKSLITVDDIIEEINHYSPHIVYIDGFSFMVDRRTNRMTDDWQANENVAAELKALAMEEQITIFVNTQVQEKQYAAKHGIEARTIAGGTGLLKASDLVIGSDKDGNDITVNCVLSRYEYFDDVVLEVNWDNMLFSAVEPGEKLKEMGV